MLHEAAGFSPFLQGLTVGVGLLRLPVLLHSGHLNILLRLLWFREIPHLVGSVGVVLTPDLHPSSSADVVTHNIEDEDVPLTPDMFPLQPPCNK